MYPKIKKKDTTMKRPVPLLKCILKMKLGQFSELKDGIGVAKSWKNLKNGKKFKSFY